MTLAQFLTELNIRIGDSDNFTFTPEEKNSALTEAFNDDYAQTDKWSTSLTFTAGTYQYAKPSGVDVIYDIYIKPDNSSEEPEKIASELWEVVGSNLQFKNSASNVIPTGYTLYLRGKTKYGSGDNVTEVNVQEYLLNLAQLRLYKIMLAKKTMRFLKNDTSVSEIVTVKRDLEQDVAKYRQRLPKQYQVA